MRDLARFDNEGFERGRPIWVEALWWLVRSVFFLGSLPLPSSWRVFWLRAFGAQVGNGVVVRARVNISFPWRLTIGNHVWLGEEAMILSLDKVQIESHVCISQRAFLCTGSHDYQKPAFDLLTQPIVIREGAWIGAACFVGPGVTVGSGSVCAAGAVVTKSVPNGVVVGGNPASVIKDVLMKQS